MASRNLRKNTLTAALGLCLLTLLPVANTMAASTDGALIGRVSSAAPGTTVHARNVSTGLERTATVDSSGNYRFPYLPVGDYSLEVIRDGKTVQKLDQVRISLGNATTVNIGATEKDTMDRVEVRGGVVISAVDVSSTESASNFTAAEIDRLPVADSLTAVALLAPGVGNGDPGLGGISFGGSGVAENTTYINGLNVTDFYDRIGASAVPYKFYEAFQVKTGGYSVEFGRTTGGVMNAVTKSGSNDFHYGAELVYQPDYLKTAGTDRYFTNPTTQVVSPVTHVSDNEADRTNISAYASGAIVQDRLFFYGMYEVRNYDSLSYSADQKTQFNGSNGSDFWGGKIDLHVNDKNLIEFTVFSDSNQSASKSYQYDPVNGQRGSFINTGYTETGGINRAFTWTSYLTESLSAKFLYGGTNRQLNIYSPNDLDCNYISDTRVGTAGIKGCTSNLNVRFEDNSREALRADFEWSLGAHLLRFGMDHETNTSEVNRTYAGPGGVSYTISTTKAGNVLANGGVVPAGVTSMVASRNYAIGGEFETLNSAYYLEDTWSVTDTLVLNGGLRMESFDNKNAEGVSFIKLDNMFAPRIGFSWDMKGDGRSKLFGNAGRYFLPVSNVINVKQAGGILDVRTWNVFNGYETFEYNGASYQRPILGAQIGNVDYSNGNGSVPDVRAAVDSKLDPVFQDEYILGFQSQINNTWSYGVRGIYRELNNLIDDMRITSSGYCEGVMSGSTNRGYHGFVMGNPGKDMTVYVDTDCNGVKDAYTTIDTSKEGWARYNALNNSTAGKYLGVMGWVAPKRTYKALEFVVDRAWDNNWSMNASYTLSYSEGNVEGTVNSTFNNPDSGQAQDFDTPFVNRDADGPLPNDRRHQFKMRGVYAFNENWSVGSTFSAMSGTPLSIIGGGNPYDGTRNFYSYYICVQNCTASDISTRVFELNERGAAGRTPSIFDLSANITYQHPLGEGNKLRVDLSAFNLFNQEQGIQYNELLQDRSVTNNNVQYGQANSWQSPRYGQLTVSVDF